MMQITVQNPDATMPLVVPVLVLPNTSVEVGDAQIRANGLMPTPWLKSVPAHDGVAVLCGGGPSLREHADRIAMLAKIGGTCAAPKLATVFGLNGAAGWLIQHNIPADYQVIVDPKLESSALVEPYAEHRLFASQVHPETAAYADTLFHLANEGIEDLLPPDRVAAGGYTLIGGGVSVGITALMVAYAMGFREMHLFGYDSSHRDGEGHAYRQPMNSTMPCIDVEWAGKTYHCAMPMKLQAEAFLRFAPALEAEGVKLLVHGDGLLPAMWATPPMNEREKYQKLWTNPDYRAWSPGEDAVPTFLEVVKPDGLIVDFGCGTGRAALALVGAGHDVLCVDFTDNSRDPVAMGLSFLQCDLTQPLPFHAPYGLCTDVMEHIPTDQVQAVIDNIMGAAERVFFQIATRPDNFGATIGQKLHLTVKPHGWWTKRFADYRIEWQDDKGHTSCFYVARG